MESLPKAFCSEFLAHTEVLNKTHTHTYIHIHCFFFSYIHNVCVYACIVPYVHTYKYAMCAEFTAKLKPRPSPASKNHRGRHLLRGSKSWQSWSQSFRCWGRVWSLSTLIIRFRAWSLWLIPQFFSIEPLQQSQRSALISCTLMEPEWKTLGFLARSRGDAFLHQLLFHGEQGLPIGPKDS